MNIISLIFYNLIIAFLLVVVSSKSSLSVQNEIKNMIGLYKNEIKSNADQKVGVLNKEIDSLISFFNEEKKKIETKNSNFDSKINAINKEILQFENDYYTIKDKGVIINKLEEVFINSYGIYNSRYCLNFAGTLEIWYFLIYKNVHFTKLYTLL